MGLSGPLTDRELDFLAEVAASGHRSIMMSAGCVGFTRMIKLRYVRERPAGVDGFLYVLTDRGRRALAGKDEARQPR